MCAICGCSNDRHEDDHRHGRDHRHDHDHTGPDHHHAGSPGAHGDHLANDQGRLRPIVSIERDVLAKNDALAVENRAWLAARDIFALNLVSSPGAGKTTLLERSIRDLGPELSIHVVEGDQATERDAARIRKAGAHAVQVNTGAGCHLDAGMVSRALATLDPPRGSLLFIENVGNLVCPALFDLGERFKIVVLSVTEGDDKPIKYPHMFRASDVMLLNKIDLLPYVEFDIARCVAMARSVNPRMSVFQVSATRGDGLGVFHGWLREQTTRGRPA